MVHRNGGIPKRGSSSKPKGYDLCHKCGKPGQFIKDCPLLKKDQYKHNTYKATKRNPVPDKRFKKKNAADNVVKQTLAAWGDSSSESEEDDDQGDSSMMARESKATEYDSIFALMAQSENDDDDDEVNFLDVQRNLNLINDKNALTVELGYIEHERDDLLVVVVDLKETIECVKKEKEALTEKVANIEHDRDDLLVVVIDLKETIEELKGEGRHEILQKGKEVADETHLRLEDEIKLVKSSLCVELEKNKQLQEELSRVKSDLEKSLKWTWFSEAITAMYMNNRGNRQGIEFQRKKTPYNPHSNLLSVSQICDKGNKVEFVSKISTITNLVTDLNCSSAVDNDAELWHRRLGYVSFMLLNKLVKKDLDCGLPNSSFKNHKVYDACVQVKQVRSSFKPKKEVSTSRPLDLLHMDLCGPMRVPSRGGNNYIFVIEDDYSRFTWTFFLRSKDETFEVFVAFVKMIQVKISHNVVSIRSDHGT
ncbi:uncharacterized protein [Nicotiana tomentosiformis]|uniref:uncharacterized protein n=1 Tax=Nicotiana tomentosiformis TaxID=4098 RepID=UPI00388C63EE